MLDRMINWVKSLFHEETPEEQDKRIHETIESCKMNTVKCIESYHQLCCNELLNNRLLVGQEEPVARHLKIWDEPFPHIDIKDYELDARIKWHEAHVMLANLYCFDVTDPPDGSLGRFNKHVDIRPAKWLKDLADEEKIIKALQMEANAKQYQV